MKIYLLRVAAALLLPPLLYFCAALILGIAPVNPDFTQAQAGVDIYARANAVHADLLIPMHSAQRDWRARLPDLADAEYLAVGWGDRAFYLETRQWSELRTGNALRALLGMDRSVLHIAAEGRPGESADTVRITISEAQFAAILAQIDATFEPDASSGPILIPGAKYGDNDRFYEARGHYSMLTTCNEWVRTVLSNAGIRTAAWAPFAPALLYQARQVAKSPKQGATPTRASSP